MTSTIRRREFMAGLGAGLIAAPAIVRAEGPPIVIRAGALKLIHSIAPYFYEQFADFEKGEIGFQDAFGPMLTNLNLTLGREQKRAREIAFGGNDYGIDGFHFDEQIR